MDIKYILLESMSHHILPSLLSSLQWAALESTLQDISKFHDDYQQEAADLIMLAYRHGTYSKVGLLLVLLFQNYSDFVNF